MPREHIKPRISRTITPRNIRAIKPKRQLAWNKQHDEVDDDLWYTTVYGDSTKQGGGSSSTSRSRQSFNNNIEDDDYDSEEEENDNIPRSSKICKLLSIFKAIYKCFICICKSTKSGYDSIRKLPPTQRRNRFLLFLILICVLRIYLRSMFMNLNQYSLFNNESKKSITPVIVGRSSMPLDTDDGWEESSALFGTPPKTQSKVMGGGGAAVSSPLYGSSSASNLRGGSSGGSMGSSLSSGIHQLPQSSGLNINSQILPQQTTGYGASGSLNTYGASSNFGSQLQSNTMQMGMKTNQYGNNLVGGSSLQQQPMQQQAQMPQQNQLQYNINPLQANTQTQYKQPVLGNQYLSSSGSQQQSLNSGIVGNSQQQGMSGNGYSGGGANMQNFF